MKSAVFGSWFMVMCMIFFMTLAQLFFKSAAVISLNRIAIADAWFFNEWIWYGMASMVIASFFWFFALRRLPLSEAYPWTALIYVLTPLASLYFFDDTLDIRFVVGMVLVILGVVISTLGMDAKNDSC